MIKDSGKRETFESGMQRDVTDGKVDYTLALDGPMFERYARHLTEGAKKYSKRNWMKASGEAELARFKESALRHFMQWYRGDSDEDHAASVWFNINGAEYVKGQELRHAVEHMPPGPILPLSAAGPEPKFRVYGATDDPRESAGDDDFCPGLGCELCNSPEKKEDSDDLPF